MLALASFHSKKKSGESCFRLAVFFIESKSAAQLQMCQRTDRITDNNNPVIENFLKFLCSFIAAFSSQNKPPHEHRSDIVLRKIQHPRGSRSKRKPRGHHTVRSRARTRPCRAGP